MKTLNIVLLCIWLACSCKNIENKDRASSISFINENFLSIVDTSAYRYNTLRPAPNEKITRSFNSYHITIFNKLFNPLKKQVEILDAINKLKDSNDIQEYHKIIVDNLGNTAEYTIDNATFSNTEKFRLTLNNDRDIKKIGDKNLIGHLFISRVLFNKTKDRAMLLVTTKDNIKNGITNLLLFKKTNGFWNKHNEMIVEIW